METTKKMCSVLLLKVLITVFKLFFQLKGHSHTFSSCEMNSTQTYNATERETSFVDELQYVICFMKICLLSQTLGHC